MITGALAEDTWMLVIDDLGEATVERAGALVAREHAAARQVRPELPPPVSRMPTSARPRSSACGTAAMAA